MKALILGLVVILVYALLHSEITDAQDEIQGDAAIGLASPSSDVRKKAATRLLAERERLIKSLLVIASDEAKGDPNEPRALAVRLLGELRVKEAAPLLIKNVDYVVFIVRGDDDPIQAFPCALALTKIGNTIYPDLWRRLSSSDANDLQIKLFVYVVRAIDGEVVGRARLTTVLERTADYVPLGRLNLQNNLNRMLKHYDTKRTGF